MAEIVPVQWFPGHMAKTRRLMQANLKLVDLVVELTDARIPQSSRNPELDRLLGKKPRLLLLNKSDSADEEETRRWLQWYKDRGVAAIAADCRTGKGLGQFLPAVRSILEERIAQWEARGEVGRPIRMMIVGIPNVGKSSLINRLAGGKRAKVEDRPGVTRGKQWVSLAGGVELLDMPGVLWPKFEDQSAGERLAFVGSVKDDVIDIEHLAVRLLEVLAPREGEKLAARYRLTAEEVAESEPFDLLELIGRRRGMLLSGGLVNTERAAIMVVDEFRGGLWGRITLEPCPEKEDRL
ncbi:MAG: ribosome biogenesis GTPase YlqF [Angelakisella sp.]|jgi:ribosome biogenesis GTPase A|nr:ribosome biogenesis GTPase YlqF [Angelakisella sp.]